MIVTITLKGDVLCYRLILHVSTNLDVKCGLVSVCRHTIVASHHVFTVKKACIRSRWEAQARARSGCKINASQPSHKVSDVSFRASSHVTKCLLTWIHKKNSARNLKLLTLRKCRMGFNPHYVTARCMHLKEGHKNVQDAGADFWHRSLSDLSISSQQWCKNSPIAASTFSHCFTNIDGSRTQPWVAL